MNSSSRRAVVGIVAASLAAGLSVAGVATPAQAAAAPVRLVVGFKSGVDSATAQPTLSRFGIGSNESKGGNALRAALAEVSAKALDVPAAKATALMAALRLDPSVAYVQVDPKAKAFDVAPNDPVYAQGHQPELKQIKVPTAWSTTTGKAVKVAVVDTGVSGVGDLSGKVLRGYDFVNNDNNASDDGDFPHGTVVASLIAAKANNSTGMAGVCTQCQILPVKVLDSAGSGSYSDVAAGIIYAAKQGAKIINLSLGGAGDSPVLKDAVAYANGRGALVVAAAGNEGSSQRQYPAAYGDVLAVGATNTRTGGTARADFSSYGSSWVDVAAPGITAGMRNNGQYCWDGNTAACWDWYYNDYEVQGTSFAAPLVAGVAALVHSKNPKYIGWSLSNAITSSARGIGGWVKYGLVDANAALSKGYDTAKPSASGSNLSHNQLVRGSRTVSPVGLKDTGGSGIRNVDLYLNGKWHSWDYVAPFAPKLNTAGKNGPIKVQLRLTDKAGNISWAPHRWIVADNTKPKLSITKAPKNKAKVKGTVTITAKASDKYKVAKVQLLVNNKVVATDTKAGYKLSFKVSKQKKTMKVVVRAYDKAGNMTKLATRTYYRR
ncbi:S8 family serine peptidase [Actinoplanes sp. DH11]|uniref:S8 family serine peptidase n=1 Tax=Actinoplanes sp. DH11 TaxID=2857011 RepID=UPI001E5A2049|nr:S8 family serine peptidase [Actinoplanes sp. DH11]